MKVFTFWEGKMPDYIKLCMKTWKVDYVLLNYDNVNQYTDIDLSKLSDYSLPQIADYIRVHVLRDNGGYWLDTDTIMITDKLFDTNMVGSSVRRTNTIGYLCNDYNSQEMFKAWADYQDNVIHANSENKNWSIMGNDFTDFYVKDHKEITISDVFNCWPEYYMIKDDISRKLKYIEFYFRNTYHLKDLRPTNMLMLHNSWTPEMYKELPTMQVLNQNCTLSNILREMIL